MRAAALPAIAFAALATSAVAQAQTTSMQTRADQLLAMLDGKAAPEGLFTPAFLAAVPPAQITGISASTSRLFGKPLRIVAAPRDTNSAKLAVTYERGTVDMVIQLDPSPPNQVTGLLITGSTFTGGLPQVVRTLRGFPGATGFAFAKLGQGAPQTLSSLDPDRAIALGSAFKLVILAELVRETAANERQWSDMIALDGRPLPGGIYTKLPAGTKVSLLELARKMISISDNSAADILLATLGRAKVEAMMTQVGWQGDARDRPFLSTLEMFKIKGIARFREAWPTLDEKGRRALLVQIDAAPPSEIDPALFKDGRPILIDQAEWFASPADMIRTMDWLRKHSESGPGAQARAILAINPGLPRGAGNAQWSYIGFKGGSEPGVVTMNFLLQGKDSWYAMSGGWNNSANKVDDNLFVGLMAGAIGTAGR